MDSQPRKRLNHDVLNPSMPQHVRQEIVDLLAEALVADMQQNQQVGEVMVVPPRGFNHNASTEETRTTTRKTTRSRLRVFEE